MQAVTEYLLQHEKTLRMGFFFGVFLIMAAWEVVAQRRVLRAVKGWRWLNNLGLVVLNRFVLMVVFPAGAVGVAAYVEQHGWGLMNYYQLAPAYAVLLSIVLLDMIIYLQHVMVHAVPALWRLHRVHHADPDYDVTTGLRFHPLEILLSMLIKFAAIVALGAPVVAVIIFEIILNAAAMFNHGNVRLPAALDRYLRWIIVTPDMHRVHHSVEDDEANSNFGFNLPWWDRLFGTYREQPRKGHVDMQIGIHNYTEPKQVVWLSGILSLPFVGKVTGYAINRREWKDNE